MIETEAVPHPRPGLARDARWLPLDGEWEFRRDPADDGLEQNWFADTTRSWDERIRVPFAWETAASGVEAHWMPVGWYRRVIDVPAEWSDARIVLIIGGVHHEATVWADGVEVGHIAGGHAGLECELKSASNGALGGRRCTVVVRVVNPVDKRFVPHGKQRSIPPDDFDGCQFTPSSGIWQSVWLEARPRTSIRSLSLRPAPDLTAFSAVVETEGPATDGQLDIQVGSEQVVEVPVINGRAVATLPVPAPRLWSPRDPYLYDITATLHADGEVDVVTSLAGLRSIEARGRDLYLNGERIYLRGVLDQGYWPDTGLTAPGPDALRRDLELAGAAGFNFIRKHLKFEDPRQLHLADQMGMLMWVEPPSIGRYGPESVQAFENLVPEMIKRYGNHPSVIIWGLYNEEWGLDWQAAEDPQRADALRRVKAIADEHDTSRLIVDNSGWAHVRTDIVDWHVYTDNLNKWDEVVSRVAAGSLDILPIGLGPDHDIDRPLWATQPDDDARPILNTEYGVGMTSIERGWHLRWQTQRLRREDAICGYIYCELTDIEHETAGTYTADRRHKDLGGTEPADVHADTVLIPDLVPIRPGADLHARAGEDLTISVFVSHHGPSPFVGTLHWSWEHSDGGAGSVAATAKPHVRSDPVTIRTVVPSARPGAAPPRLRFAAANADGTTAATTFIDVGLVPASATGDSHSQ